MLPELQLAVLAPGLLGGRVYVNPVGIVLCFFGLFFCFIMDISQFQIQLRFVIRGVVREEAG